MPANRREVSWCVEGVEPYSVYGASETVYMFDPKTATFDGILVRSGVFKTFKQARDLGYKGPVPLGWTGEIINDVGFYCYNPDPNYEPRVPWDAYP